MKKITKKLFSSLFTSVLLLPNLSILAGEVSTVTSNLGLFVAEDPQKKNGSGNVTSNLYRLNSSGAATLLQEDIFPDLETNGFQAGHYAVDQSKGKVYFLEGQRPGGGDRRYRIYDVENNTFDGYVTVSGLPDGASPISMGIPSKINNTIEKKCESTDSDCNDSSDTKFVSLGGEGTDELLRIDNDGISQGGSTGKSLVKYVGDELHIGENSWITKEENGRQKVYAKDAAGNPIPIDYTNGTKLLINGRDVEQSINNVGALSAALTGLPTVPSDTTLACGFGTGTHGGDFAFAGGCASKLNETLSVNYAASMTMPGQDYAGDFEDTFSARAGFVWALGKPVKPTLISIKEKKEFESQINTLEETNKQLLARLEKLEKVALGSIQSKDLASNKIDFKSVNRDIKKMNFNN